MKLKLIILIDSQVQKLTRKKSMQQQPLISVQTEEYQQSVEQVRERTLSSDNTPTKRKITAYQTYKGPSQIKTLNKNASTVSSKSSHDSQRSPILQKPKLVTKIETLYLQKPSDNSLTKMDRSAISFSDQSGLHQPLSPRQLKNDMKQQNDAQFLQQLDAARRATDPLAQQQIIANYGNVRQIASLPLETYDLDAAPNTVTNLMHNKQQIIKKKTAVLKDAKSKQPISPMKTSDGQSSLLLSPMKDSSAAKQFQLAGNIGNVNYSVLPKSNELQRAALKHHATTMDASKLGQGPTGGKKEPILTLNSHNQIAKLDDEGQLELLMVVNEDDGATIYGQSEVNSPNIPERAISAVGHVKVQTNQIAHQEQVRVKTQETFPEQSDSVLHALELYATTTNMTIMTNEDRDGQTTDDGKNYLTIKDDTLYGTEDKPLPLRKINREKMYQQQLLKLKQQARTTGAMSQSPTTRNTFIDRSKTNKSSKRGSKKTTTDQNASKQADGKSKSSLMVDSRGRQFKEALRSPFRSNTNQYYKPDREGDQRLVQQQYSLDSGRNAMKIRVVDNSTAQGQSLSHQTQHLSQVSSKSKGGVPPHTYTLSPTQTHLLSQKMTGSSGQISLMATSFNKLPSVDGKKPTAGPDMIKALFNRQQQSNAQLHDKAKKLKMSHKASHKGSSSRVINADLPQSSMNDLLQRVAELSIKRNEEGDQHQGKTQSNPAPLKPPLMLNEQSTGALPTDPALAKEMEDAHKAVSHLKIMDNPQLHLDPLFMMQPNSFNMQQSKRSSKQASKQTSKQENYNVMIKASSREPLPSSRENGANISSGYIVKKPVDRKDSNRSCSSDGVNNLIQMQQIADELSKQFLLQNSEAGSNANLQPAPMSSNQILPQQQASLTPNEQIRREIEKQNVYDHAGLVLNAKARRQSDVPSSKPFMSLYRSEQRQQSLRPHKNLLKSVVQQQSGAAATMTLENSFHKRASTNPSPKHLLPDLNKTRQKFSNLNTTMQSSSIQKKSHQVTFGRRGLSQDVSFGAIQNQFAKHNQSTRYFEKLTDQEKLKILNLAQKAHKPQPKRGLTCRNQVKKAAGTLPSSIEKTAKQAASSPPRDKSGDLAGDYQKKLPDLRDIERHLNTPVMMGVISPVKIPQEGFQHNESAMTLYQNTSPHVQNSRMSINQSPQAQQQLATDSSLKDKSEMRLRPTLDLTDSELKFFQMHAATARNTNMQQQPNQTQSTWLNMQNSSTLYNNSNNKTSQQKTLLGDQSALRRAQNVEAPDQTSKMVLHQNSSQNLYNKEMIINQRKVLLKVQGPEPRRKQHPSISKQPPRPGEDQYQYTDHQIDSSVAQKKAGSFNPFQLKKQSEQHESSNLPELSHEVEKRKKAIQQMQENLVKEKLLEHQHQPFATQSSFFTAAVTAKVATGAYSQRASSKQSIQLPSKVNVTSRLSRERLHASILEEISSKGKSTLDSKQPRTKREYLLKYKQDLANEIKEQSRQNDKMIEMLKKAHQPIRKKQPKPGEYTEFEASEQPEISQHLNQPPADQVQVVNPMSMHKQQVSYKPTEELDSTNLVYLPNSRLSQQQQYLKNRENEQLKSADFQQQRPKAGEQGAVGSGLSSDIVPLQDANQAINKGFLGKGKQLFGQALMTFQNQPSPQKLNQMMASEEDSTETYVDGHMGTLKLPKDRNTIQASIILKVAKKGFPDFMSNEEDSRKELMNSRDMDADDVDAGEESFFNQPDDSNSPLLRNLQKKQKKRPKFEDIEKMEQDHEMKQKQKELAQIEFAKRKATIKKQQMGSMGAGAISAYTEKPPQGSNRASESKMATLSNPALIHISESSQHIANKRKQQKQQQVQASVYPSLNERQDKSQRGPPTFIMEQNNEDIINILQQKQ